VRRLIPLVAFAVLLGGCTLHVGSSEPSPMGGSATGIVSG